MKKGFFSLIAAGFIFGFIFIGCGPQKAESSREAIDVAKAMETTQEQLSYLINQAKAFYNSEEFQGTIEIAQYIVRYVDSDSDEAKNLLERAREALTAAAREKLPGF